MLQKIRHSTFVRTLGLMPSQIRWVYYPVLIVNQLIWAFFMNLILAFIMKDVLDAAVQADMALLERAIYLAASAMFIGVPGGCALMYAMHWCMKRTLTAIRKRTFTKVNALTMQTFERHHTGDLISRMTNDVDATERLFWEMENVTYALICGIVGLGATFMLDWRFGYLVLTIGLTTVVVNAGFARPLRSIGDSIQACQGALTERLTDLIQSVPVAKMFHLERHVHSEYTKANFELIAGVRRRAHFDGLFRATSNLLTYLKESGILIYGLYLILNDDAISIGTVAAILYFQGSTSALFARISNFLTGIQQALAGAHRLFETLDSPEEQSAEDLDEVRKGAVSEADPAAISICNLRFSYQDVDGTTNQVLHDFSISVREGHVAALVGPSGGGKSTLLKLLLGFYSSSAGTLLINGRSIDIIGLKELRDLMAYVPQDAYIFDGTIEDNIRYGRPSATKEDIIAAARAAHADEFVLAQPDGYGTRVGERGMYLSGGQRQRIAIARALLKNAPILLLDEATSALDSESEQLVQDALETLMQGRTTVAIAHRLSTIEHANVIYVLDQGRLVEQGKHKDLLDKKGLYHRLHHLQFRTKKVA